MNRAVSSVVEHLVYTERVGVRTPHRPISIFDFRFSVFRLELLRQHRGDGGFAVNFRRIKKRNPIMGIIAQNQRQFCSCENHAINVALRFHAIDDRE